jgi:hypothetical protein
MDRNNYRNEIRIRTVTRTGASTGIRRGTNTGIRNKGHEQAQ